MSIFSKIIDGEIPGRFVWEDAVCVAFATIEPAAPGHVLLVPRKEVDKYTDLDPKTFAHMANVAQIIGQAQEKAFAVSRTIITILGFDVPHTHVHIIPAADAQIVQKISAPKAASAAQLDATMEKLRSALCELGFGENVPQEMFQLSSAKI